PICGSIWVQTYGGFELLAGARSVQVFGRVVVDMSKSEVVVGVLRVVFDGAFVDCGVGLVVSSNPGGKKKPPCAVDDGPADYEDESDRNELARPGRELDFPVSK